MSGFWALVRKQLAESRWMLGISWLALFAFGWLSVFVTAVAENRIRKAIGEGNPGERMRFARMMAGEGAEATSTLFEMQFWLHPFVILPVIVWAISRGSLTVAGELERGSMDLVLSRPLTRSTYLLSQAAVAVGGLCALTAALVVGTLVGTFFNKVEQPSSVLLLCKPASNLVALGFAILGFTWLVSTIDSVRWRSILVGSVVTTASYAAWVIAHLPVMSDSRWKVWLERTSIFTAYNPVEAVSLAAKLPFNLLVLSTIGLLGIVLGFVGFSRRDLPAGGG